MRNLRILSRRLVAGAAVTLLAVGGTMVSTSGASASLKASPTPVLQLRVGSADYLVYTKLRATGHSRTGGLFVRNKDGKTRRLATIGGQAAGFSLAGSILVYGHGTDAYPFNENIWTDLKTGQSGVIPDSGIVAAAPGGWVTLTTTDSIGTLTYHSTDGAVQPLGQPFPQSVEPVFLTGADNLVTYSVYSDDSNGNGELRVMSFDDPGTYRTLMESAPSASQGRYHCSTVTAKYVVCRTATKEHHGQIRLIPLDGSPQVTTTKGCPAFLYQAVVHGSAAWQGCGGKLTVLSPDGKVHVSSHKYAGDMVPAYGKLAVVTPSGHSIELVSSVTSKAKILVRVG